MYNKNNTFNQLYEMILDLPFIDSHEHLENMTEWDKGDFFAEYTDSYIGQDLISAGMPESDYKKLSDKNIPLKERYKLFAPYFEYVKFTGYGSCFNKTLKALLGEDKLSENNLDICEIKFLERRKAKTFVQFFKDECNFENAVVDYMGYEWEYPKEYFLQSYNFSLMLTIENMKRFDRIAWFTGVEVTDFDSYVNACIKIIQKKHDEQNVKVLKLAAAYYRPINFPETSYSEAKEEFDEAFSLLKNEETVAMGDFRRYKGLQNYVIHKTLEFANENKMTVQVHTGYLAGNQGDITDADPYLLIPVLQKYKNIKFDIFHMSYPDFQKAGALAKCFPNAYVNMCWTHILSPETSKKGLEEWLDTIPVNKIIGFGGDFLYPDMIYGHKLMAVENVAFVLSNRINENRITMDEAMEIAKAIFYINPKRLYQIF